MWILVSYMLLVTALAFLLVYATTRQHQLERQDLLDRLMARDLRELKQAQTGPTAGRAVSKSANDARLVEEARRVAEGRDL